MTAGLDLIDLSFAYDRDPVVRGVTLSVEAGEIVSLLGPSGCGKTTCLRLAAGLEVPADGEIRVDGRVVAGPGVFEPPERRRVGLVLQDFALFPHMTVLANVIFGMTAGDKAGQAAEGRALLDAVGLADYAQSWPHQLSGGQQQRVALARALAPSPAAMLMDEPFSSLDVTLRSAVRETAVRVLKDRKAPTLIVTHDPEEALQISDRIAVMRSGLLEQVGTPEEIFRQPASGYVMRLFGHVNSFLGTVVSGSVATPLGPIAVSGQEEGTRVEVLCRTTDVKFGDAGVPARVLESRLLGATRLVILEIEGCDTHIRMERSRHEPVSVGETVSLTCEAGTMQVFALETEPVTV